MATKLQPGGSVQTDWRAVNELCDDVTALQKLVFQLRQDAQRRQIYGDNNAYLFNIYQSSTWLKYKVTAGYLITTGDPITVTNTETEITITTGVARYWFYLDVTATTAAIATSATTLTWDATNKIPIGWVDTDTYSAESRAVIHQREHIFVPCAI